jgi:hypothetical protein
VAGPLRISYRREEALVAELEDRLMAQALALVEDMREDLDSAHRAVRYLDRLELEQLACVLAAMVPVDLPLATLAWWRLMPQSGEAA